MNAYRGRLAPSPTGFLHLGHARTFWVAHERARAAAGQLIFRNEDLDHQRSRPEFVQAMFADLRWLGLIWDEGPDVGGSFGPYTQGQRRSFYLDAWEVLRDRGFIYPCTCSRKDLARALEAPHEDEPEEAGDELRYPGTCRSRLITGKDWSAPAGVSWRFKISDGEPVSFNDDFYGRQTLIADKDFTDFLVWRRDDIPAYQLAVTVDDAAMRINEVVRGADLLKSTARQLLLFRALESDPPRYFHCPLLRDENNLRLAKRHDSLSLQALRNQGVDPSTLRERFAREIDWKRNLSAT
jgi:glutamyl/glutaminyl-tRNA synthetase